MPYVQADIDMGDIDTEDLVEELVKRFKTFRTSQKPSYKEKQELKEAMEELLPFVGMGDYKGIPKSSLEDVLKRDAILAIWDKYTSQELEDRLK